MIKLRSTRRKPASLIKFFRCNNIFRCQRPSLGICIGNDGNLSSPSYGVRTATLVAPRTTPPLSVKRTKIRWMAGSNGIGPLPVTKIPKVGVAFALIWVVTVGTGGPRQAPVVGVVWQSARLTGRLTPPVSAETVMRPPVPTFTVATAKTPVLARVMIPSLVSVAARASVDPDLLIIDEALAVGDFYFQKKCIDRIISFHEAGKTILFCSHNMYQVRTICERVIWLRDGKIALMRDAQRVVDEYESYLRERMVQEVAAREVAPSAQAPEVGPRQSPWITEVILSVEGESAPKDPVSDRREHGDHGLLRGPRSSHNRQSRHDHL